MQSWYVLLLVVEEEVLLSSGLGLSRSLYHCQCPSTQALPDDPELTEVKELCHSIIQEEQVFITVSYPPSHISLPSPPPSSFPLIGAGRHAVQ